jgi:hypothetical protein
MNWQLLISFRGGSILAIPVSTGARDERSSRLGRALVAAPARGLLRGENGGQERVRVASVRPARRAGGKRTAADRRSTARRPGGAGCCSPRAPARNGRDVGRVGLGSGALGPRMLDQAELHALIAQVALELRSAKLRDAPRRLLGRAARARSVARRA